MDSFCCPVCGQALIEYEKRFVCVNNHSFDKAKQGYVNLFMSQQSSLKRHGDDKLMVQSRRDFLKKGYYFRLCEEITSAINSLSKTGGVLIDVGCGEGYYTSQIKEKCSFSDVFGIDISKNALQYAAKDNKEIKFAVASAFSLPFADEFADIILNAFAPCAYDEFFRILKKDGFLVKVVPLSEHLWDLKKVLYENPYKNKPEIKNEELFELVFSKELKYDIHLNDKRDIFNLFTMTPYYYKTSKDDSEKLFELDELVTTVNFAVEIYKRKCKNVRK
ncbi:MAG: methyltransferase domain-containing protein [Clostridia bacterium]|nr:methyltransferase domain-containing protein [Clostridia bacterium]